MSDARIPSPLVWSHGGKDYPLAIPDFDLELLFQSIHERWTRNRVEAMVGGISEEAHRQNLAMFLEQVATNHPTFVSPSLLTKIGEDLAKV